MRARLSTTETEFRLFQDEQEIGYVDGTTVGFRGFASSAEAALAASVAYRSLARRRGEQEPSQDSLLDSLVVEPDGSPVAGWGFEIELLPEERLDIFATARARLMWRALRSNGIDRRMLQFGGETPASL